MNDPEAQLFETFSLILDCIVLVELSFQNQLDHTVSVYTTRTLISDIAERYPLSFTTEALFLCAGGSNLI